MTLFSDASFFILLAVAIVPAAVIGLTEHSLRHYGVVLSAVLVAAAFWGQPVQALGLVAYLVLSRCALCWLARDPKSERRFVAASLVTLCPLLVYKVSAVFSLSLWGFIGISYITFKGIQMVMETHDGLITRKDLGFEDWLYFLLFFPQFSSGPIDRSRRFAADAHGIPSRDEYAGLLARGILLLLLGAVYKMVIATLIHRYYSPTVWGTGDFGTELWAQVKTAYLYGGYLFFDFAGYSFMAMGASYCLGIRCPRNFRAPFIATDIFDFWNRWHITLSTWFRDFVFMRITRWLVRRKIVKGRVRVAQCGFLANMLIMGFWHGITIDYIGYGLFHGVLLAATEGIQKRSRFYKAHRHDLWFRILSWFVTLQLVILGFSIFSGQISMLVEGAING